MSEEVLKSKLWIEKITTGILPVDEFTISKDEAKANFIQWQKRYAVAGKVIELTQGHQQLDDNEKQNIVDELKFIKNSSSPRDLLPYIKLVLPTEGEGPINQSEVDYSEYWDNVRSFAYAGAGIAAPFYLTPPGAAASALFLAAGSLADDYFMTKPQYRLAEDILKAGYDHALVQSHEALMQSEDFRDVIESADLSEELLIEELEPKLFDDPRANELDRIYHRLNDIHAQGGSVEALINEYNTKLGESAQTTRKLLRDELTRRENLQKRTTEQARIERINVQRIRGEYDAGVKLIALAAEKLFGSPEASQIITASYQGYKQIENAIAMFTAVPPAMGPIGLTFTAVSTIMNIVGIFGKSGPSPEQQILESLQAVHQGISDIKKMIADLAKHLDDRLDEINRSQLRILGVLEEGIADILEAQDLGFNRIALGIKKLENRLEIVGGLVTDLALREVLDEYDENIETIEMIQNKGAPISANDITRVESILITFSVKSLPPYNWLESSALTGPSLDSWTGNEEIIVDTLAPSKVGEIWSSISLIHHIANEFHGYDGKPYRAIPHPLEWVKYVISYYEVARSFPNISRHIAKAEDFKLISKEAIRITKTLLASSSVICAHRMRKEYLELLKIALDKAFTQSYRETIPNAATTIFPPQIQSTQSNASLTLSIVGYLDREMMTSGPHSFEREYFNFNRSSHGSDVLVRLSNEIASSDLSDAQLTYFDDRPDFKVYDDEDRIEVYEHIADAHAYGDVSTEEIYKYVDRVSLDYHGRYFLGYDPIELAQKFGLIQLRKLPERSLRRERIEVGTLGVSPRDQGFGELVIVERIIPYEITFSNHAHFTPGLLLTNDNFGTYSCSVDSYWSTNNFKESKLVIKEAWYLDGDNQVEVGGVTIKKTGDVFQALHNELFVQQAKLRGDFIRRASNHLNDPTSQHGGKDVLKWKAVASCLRYAAAVNCFLKGIGDGQYAETSPSSRNVSSSIARDISSLPQSISSSDRQLSVLGFVQSELSEGVPRTVVEGMLRDNQGIDGYIMDKIIPMIASDSGEVDSLLSRYVEAHWPDDSLSLDYSVLSSIPLLVGGGVDLASGS